jgi:hypothetical protein
LVVDPSTNGVVMTDPDTGMVVDFKSMLIPENQTPERLDVVLWSRLSLQKLRV